MSGRKKNMILRDLEVTDYAAEGKSIGRVEGKVIFMENAVPGDIVDVRIIHNKKDWADGHVIHYHRLSGERLDPFCSHFGICGGCQWQMLPYEKQLRFKQQQVEESLKRIGKLDLPPLEPILGATRQREYRNKIEYTFSNRRYLSREELSNPEVSAESPVAGFHAKGIFDKVVDIDTCYLQAEPSNKIRKALREWAVTRGLSFYDIRRHEGWLRTLHLRICRTGEIMVNVVLGRDDRENTKAMLEFLHEQFPEITTLLYTINPKRNDSIQDLTPVPFLGKGYVTEKLEDFRFRIGPKSFFQTNTEQAEKLYQVAREFAELKGHETVYDLYCGTGSIGIFLSPKAKKVIGVEWIAEAVADAGENAAINGITHASFFTGDVATLCDDHFIQLHGEPDVVITDPPRAGMHEDLVKMILRMQAPLVVYISCNPATQARDLSRLGEKYRVTRIRPVDMFPHTHHIENVVQLKLKS